MMLVSNDTLKMSGSSKKSGELFSRSIKVMPSGYTRHMIVQNPYPLYASHAEGAWIWDVDGNKRIDFINNFTCLIHGHGRKEIVDIVQKQASQLMSAIMPSEWEVQLAELLCERVPSVERVRFMNSGTEAVMVAVKAARAYTGRPKMAKMEGGYHGQYDLIESSFSPLPEQWGAKEQPLTVANNVGTPQSLLDEVLVLPINDIEATTALINNNAEKLSCILIDPFRTHLANIEPSVDYLQVLRDLTKKHGIVLIFDEVMSLRVGYNGRQGQVGVTPDLTTMGKIIGGGLPVGALGGSKEVMSVFDIDEGNPKVKHSGTFTANPMSMAAGYVGMSLMTEKAFDRLNNLGDRLASGVNAAINDSGINAFIYGSGGVFSVSMLSEPPKNYRHYFSMCTSNMMNKAARFQQLLSEQGVLAMRGLFVCSTAMTNEDIDFTIAACTKVLHRMADESH